MKNFYTLIFVALSLFWRAQPYSSLLKNANWTIIKIRSNGVDYYPPSPFVQGGKVAFDFDNNNGFKSSFFNSATGKVTFGAGNATFFSVKDITVSLADYWGENWEQVGQFDYMTTSFYSQFQPTDKFNFIYEQIYSGKNLTVTNPNGQQIFYSSLILGNSETTSIKQLAIYPNPAGKVVFFKTPNDNLERRYVEIFDSTGRLVSRQKILSSNSISVERVPMGNYIIKMEIDGVEYASKLIIKK